MGVSLTLMRDPDSEVRADVRTALDKAESEGSLPLPLIEMLQKVGAAKH